MEQFIVDGSSLEDIGFPGGTVGQAVVVDHFYDPRTRLPLHDGDSVDDGFIKNAALATTALPQMDALSRGEFKWNLAITAYAAGAKATAYEELGHALHLLTEDMTQPAHTHNDPHLPPYKPLYDWLYNHGVDWAPLAGSIESQLELQTEQECLAGEQLPSGVPADVPSEFPNVYGHQEQNIGEGAARTAYLATVFPGSLAAEVPNIGENASLTIPGNPLPFRGNIGDPNAPPASCFSSANWQADGKDRTICSNPKIQYAGTAAGSFDNDVWQVQDGDNPVWQLFGGTPMFYIHPYDQIPYGGAGKFLLDYLQNSMLPLAADYSAALLSLFARTVDPIPPTFSIQLGNASGATVAENGFAGANIYVEAHDPALGDPGGSLLYPVPSGVASVGVEAINGANVSVAASAAISPPPSGQPYPDTFAGPIGGLVDGQRYQVHVVDGLGNSSYSTFTVTTAIPQLTVSDVNGTLDPYAATTDNHIAAHTVTSVAPIKFISLFPNGEPSFGPDYYVEPPTATRDFTARWNLPDKSWYWVMTCDVAYNCNEQAFGIFPPGSNPPPPPPPPGLPPSAHGPTLPAPPNPSCSPGLNCPPVAALPGLPACRLSSSDPSQSLNNCVLQAALAGLANPSIPYRTPGDPNSMTGPEGSVTPGQLMTYNVEFENVGHGTALGIYIKDVLDPALDETTLSLRDMYTLGFSTDGAIISTTPASFTWNYDANTRTMTLLAGNADANMGGSFVLEARLRSTTPPGTVIANQGLVYFPNALQQLTPTNSVISAVPLPTQVAYVGDSSGVYVSTAGLAAQLSAASKPVAQQPVQLQFLDTSTAPATDAAGIASADVLLSTGAGTYPVSVNYAGDNFYYLPSAGSGSVTVNKRAVLLQAPFASARPTDTVHLSLTATDDQGQPLQHQGDEPKTVYLDLVAPDGSASPLASSLLSGTAVSFAFNVPQPLALSWAMRARFAGDSRYAGVVSTGTLRLIDDVPPVVALTAPRGGATYTYSDQIPIQFSVTDNADLAPSATAYLVSLNGSGSQVVTSGESVPASSLASGSWTVVLSALDWAGNTASATSGPFVVTSDVLPPRTTLSTSAPSYGFDPVYVTSQTALVLTAIDDQSTVGDGVGTGVAETFYAISGGAWTQYGAPVELTAEGANTVAFYSVDEAGNAESPQSWKFFVDDIPPLSQVLVDSAVVAAPSEVIASTDTLAISAQDSGSGVAETFYELDGATVPAAALPSFKLSVGTHTLVYWSVDNLGNLEPQRTFAVTVLPNDDKPPRTSLVVGAPSFGTSPVYIATSTLLSLYAVDDRLAVGDGIGMGVAQTYLAIDTGAFSAWSASFTLVDQGTHVLSYYSVDIVGNRETVQLATVAVDATPPVSTLTVGEPQFQLPQGLLVSTATPFALTAADPLVEGVASGVKDILYRISGASPSTGPFTTFTASFTLSGLDAGAVIEFYSRDNVSNVETVRSSAVVLDDAPPELALLSPSGCDGGICRVLKGRFPVLGTARDLHLRSYQLEYAPGENAAAGFVFIGSGTASVSSGTLAAWDASQLSGWQTLRLSASDFVQNASTVSLNVWVGDPAALLALGNHDSFNLPSAVAVSSAGVIYVADRDNDRVAVFSSSGAPLASFGSASAPKGPKASPPPLTLDKPEGVAVDAAGDVYVADTNNDRVLKLSPDGAVLLTLGRLVTEGNGTVKTQPGNGPGEFNKPVGVAVDGQGLIYAADRENRRIEVFSAQGTFLRQVALPPVGTGGKSGPAGKPAGLAVDAAGNLYVADPDGGRALEFNPAGSLVLTVPIADPADGSPGQPDGVAVSPSGQCLLVADQKDGTVFKFDGLGALNLTFGTHGGHAADDPKATYLAFNKPWGLALDAAGNLYLADRNNDRVVEVGLPDGSATQVVAPPEDDDDVARGVIDHDAGGEVSRKDGVAVIIPGQALEADLQVTVSSPAQTTERQAWEDQGKKQGLVAVSSAVDFGPEGTQFAKPITLVIPYGDEVAANAGHLAVENWNEQKQEWEPMPSKVDAANRTVVAQTTHFSLYQVMVPAAEARVAGGGGADATFALRDLYVFPNPAVGGAVPTFHVAVGVADRVTIRVYDVSGRQLDQATLDSPPTIIDDGGGPKYAYEYRWEGHIPSGVYFYTVVAEKGGYAPIRRAGRFAVVR